MSAETPKPTTSDLLLTLIDEIRGLREDLRRRNGLPDVKIGKTKKHPEYDGKVASECPSDFLLEYADFLEWKAGKNRADGKMEYVASNERTALMCRRWAAANRGVVEPPKRPTFRRATDETAEPQQHDAPPATEVRPKWNNGGNKWRTGT